MDVSQHVSQTMYIYLPLNRNVAKIDLASGQIAKRAGKVMIIFRSLAAGFRKSSECRKDANRDTTKGASDPVSSLIFVL